jgi:hypothetical protein
VHNVCLYYLLFVVYLYMQQVVCLIKHGQVTEYHDVEGRCHPNLCTVALQPLFFDV